MIKPQYESENAILYLGDCLKILHDFKNDIADAVVTDPPYGLNIEYSNYSDTRENLIALIPDFVYQSKRIAKRVVITCGINNINIYPQATWILSWFSPNSNMSSPWGFSCWQPILVYGKDPYLASGKGCHPDSFSYSKLDKNKIEHPCPKPIELMKKIIERCTLLNELIVDPFMGSGTTGVAAIHAGRQFIGIEIDPIYYEIAEKRIKKAQLQMRLPINPPSIPDDGAEQLGFGV